MVPWVPQRRRPPAPAFVRNHPQDRPHVLDPKHDELVTAARGDTQEGGTQGTENPVTGTQAGGDASTAKGDRVVDPVVSSDASKGSSAEAVSIATPQPTQASAGNDVQKLSLEDSLKALPDWALPAEFLKLARPLHPTSLRDGYVSLSSLLSQNMMCTIKTTLMFLSLA